MEGLKLLTGVYDHCRTVYLNSQPNPRKQLLVPCMLDKPNPRCTVCSEKSRVETTSVNILEDEILKVDISRKRKGPAVGPMQKRVLCSVDD